MMRKMTIKVNMTIVMMTMAMMRKSKTGQIVFYLFMHDNEANEYDYGHDDIGASEATQL